MFRSILLASAALLASAGTALAQTPAPAPAPAAPVSSPVVIFDTNRLIAQSAAGTDMRTKLTAINDQVRREIEPDQRQIETELTALRALSVADAQTPAARQRQENLNRLYQAFEAKRERLAAVMELTQRNALSSYYEALDPILKSTMLARGGLVALQAGSVEAFVPGVDITADLITRLNAATRTINVTRATLPAQGAAPAAGVAPTPTPVPAAPGALPRQPARPTTPPR